MRSPRIAFAITLTLLAIALAGYIALRNAVSAKSVAVVDLAQEIDAKNAEAARLASVRDTLASLAPEETAVESYFVPDTGIVAFINGLQARGQSLGATVEITSVGAGPASGKNRPALLMSISITGPFDPVMRTLGSIEYAPYDLQVTNLTLTEADKAWLAHANLSVGSLATSTIQ